MINRVIIAGRMVADPELKRTQSGKAVTTFRIACNRKDEADFFTVVAWGSTAENVVKYTGKGRTVTVDGRLTSRQYEKDGQKRTVLEIVAENVEFGDKPQEQPQRSRDAVIAEKLTEIDEDGELPF